MLRNQAEQVRLLSQAVGYLTQLFGMRRRPNTLYDAAISFLSKDASPADKADDEVGCAESVSMVIREVLPDFPVITGTWTLWDRLKRDGRFLEVQAYEPGTIIISPTSGAKAPFPGHVGIVGAGDVIMSNSSFTGLWRVSHTIDAWLEYYHEKGEYPVYFFKLK